MRARVGQTSRSGAPQPHSSSRVKADVAEQLPERAQELPKIILVDLEPHGKAKDCGSHDEKGHNFSWFVIQRLIAIRRTSPSDRPI